MHLIEVLYDDVPVPKSPFRVAVTEGCDPSRVRAYGPGLEEGLVNKPNRFTVETRYIFLRKPAVEYEHVLEWAHLETSSQTQEVWSTIYEPLFYVITDAF